MPRQFTFSVRETRDGQDQIMKAVRITGLAVLLAMAISFARADLRFDAETGAVYDSNLSNSDRGADMKDDWAWKAHATIADGWQLSRDLRLTLAADLRSRLWARFDALDTIGGGALASLRYRFGLGSHAPWISLEERFGYDRYRDTSWSNWNESARLRGGIAVSPRLALELGYEFENRTAPDDFYDLQGHTVDARVIADLTPSWQLALGYSYREGDVASFAVPPRPDLASIALVRPRLPIFGTNPLYNGYRLVGRTYTVSVSLGYRIARYMSLQFGYEYAVTWHDPLEYENHLVEAKVAFAY
jgi:hypothetical protein